MDKNSKPSARTHIAIAVMTLLGAGSASAIEFEVGDGWKGNWNTTVSVGQTNRAESQNPLLYSKVDGAVRGMAGGLGGSKTDSGNLNYDNGDVVSQIFKFTTDVAIAKDNVGAFVRVKGWYDNAVVNNNVLFGNQGQRPYYSPGNPQPLGTDGLPLENKGQGIKLMDAYFYSGFDLGGNPGMVRLGNQVVNWGESLFLQGLNVTSPLDLPALRRGVGTEIKEFLTPIPMIYGNLGLSGGKSIEAFYQFKSVRTAVDGCGAYFSVSEGIPSDQIGNCNVASTFNPNWTNATAIQNGAYFQTVEGKKAKDDGQFGLAFRFPVEAADTEVGVYYQQLHSRTPIISVKTGARGGPPYNTLFKPGAAADSVAGFWEYPENMKMFGVTAATTIAGWSTGAELSYTADVAAQLNGNDILQAFLAGGGPLATEARTLAGALPGTTLAPLGTVFHGYDLFNKTALQLNGVKLFSNVLGAETLTVLGEIGFQWNNVPDYKNGGRRYGRAFIYGLANSPSSYGGADTCTASGALVGIKNTQPDGCQNEGFVTPFSSGIRLRGALTYNDVYGTGITATPSLFWAHDIKGVSIDGQFNEGRDTVALGLKLEMNKKYTLDMGYVTYSNAAKFDQMRDRDFFSIALSATF